MGKKTRVAIVYGGRSGEHDVSLQTAFAVLQEFDFSKYEVQPIYITREGIWRIGPRLEGPAPSVRDLAFPEGENWDLFFSEKGIDVVFPLLHGTFGEDGTIQGFLEMANIPYVGSGVMASAVGMDKVMMKKIFAQSGLPQVIYRYFNRKQWESNRDYYITEVEVSIGYPCYVKPANLGSSVGITKAKNRHQLVEAIHLAFCYDRKVIIEESVDAREIEVGVLGNDDPKVSVPGEVIPSNEFYDYNAKYVDGQSKVIIPASIPEEKAREVREMALEAYLAIEASGLARVDFFMRKGDGAIFINEINTMPGFTPYSMYPQLWKASGMTYRQLLDELISLAFERFEERQKIEYRFGQ